MIITSDCLVNHLQVCGCHHVPAVPVSGRATHCCFTLKACGEISAPKTRSLPAKVYIVT